MIAACVVIPSLSGTNPGLAPVALFTVSDLNPLVGETIQFFDESSNDPTSWSWDIDGSVFSQDQNPTYYCDREGYFSFRLTASNQYGSSQYLVYIQVTT